MSTFRPGRSFGDRAILLAVVALAIVWIAPIVWVVGLSFKPNDVLMHDTGGIVSPPFTLKNYADILASSSVFGWMFNSAVVAVGQTALTLILASLAGYGFARTNFPGRAVLFVAVLAALAVPEQAIIVPLHTMFAAVDLHNTYLALIAPRLAFPFGVLLMTQYFRAISPEIEEAALLDSASRLKVFWRIVLPLSIPAQATLGIYTFLHAWNDYFWPLVSATKPEMYTLTVGLASMQTNFAQTEGIGFLMAQAVFAGLPILVLYLFFQRHIVSAVAGAPSK
ncbi:MAG TPA: carbohydrate ABC transporter permease [Acetobacteraceae bacterium]|jgi:multiple sugar transport system permease protein|nr:carbohydrate ABC transporter permease [Acetobacteraceae bacterium]